MPSLPLPDAPSGARLPAPVGLTFEHHEPGTIGIGESHPRLSWHLQDAPAGWVQTSYEIAWEMTLPGGQARSGAATGARTGAVATETTRATSAVVPSPDQVLVPWPGPGLEARERAVVRVRVAGSDGAWSPWSEPTAAERGLAAADWRADLVGPGYDEGPRDQRRAPWLRRAFTLPSAVAITAARLHVTAHGLAEVELNGVRVGREELLPGWTPYADRLRVFGYDVTNLVRPGENAIGA